MDGAVGGDPFYWDVATVVSVLAAPDSPWARDPATLAAQIEEEGIDGETLLKFEHVCSRQEMMQCLGIKFARQKVALGEAILTFKSKSRAYQRWKHEFDKKHADGYFDDEPNWRLSLSLQPTINHPTLQSNENKTDTKPQQQASVNTVQGEIHGSDSMLQSAPGTQVCSQSDATMNETELPPPNEDDHLISLQLGNSSQELESVQITQHDPESARPTKRKRVSPLTLADKPAYIMPAFISTEASNITSSTSLDQMETQRFPWEKASPSAYLGDGSLALETIKASTGSLSSRLHEISEDSFVITAPSQLPLGRRLAVHQAMKQLLRKNSRVEMHMKLGFGAASLSDSEPILDFDDLPDAYDDETLKEIEDDEKMDRKRQEAKMARVSLSSEDVRKVLEDAMQEMSSIWVEKKLPKYQTKAYRLWNDAVRMGTKRTQIVNAYTKVTLLDERIKKLCTEIMGETWSKHTELTAQANCLEQSIQDKLYNKWLAEMLESRISPPKPDVVLRPKKPATKNTKGFLDEEILTSSDEDDFIVPDDEPNLSGHSATELDEVSGPEAHGQPAKKNFLKFKDFNQSSWGPPSPSGRVDIDLDSSIMSHSSPSRSAQNGDNVMVTPPRPNITIIQPIPEELGDFQEIGNKAPKHWAKEKDRWRMLICLIWQLSHSRRGAMIEFLQDKSMDDAWIGSVIDYISDPVESIREIGKQTPKTTSFDITRIFLSFVKIKDYQEHLPILFPLKGALKETILSSQTPWFSYFQTFIRDAIVGFQQASQMYQPDSSEDSFDGGNADDEDLLSEEIEEEEASQLRSIKPARGITQNREAVDLRECENIRVHDQKARRDKLRSELCRLDLMPRDGARLIVNESKHDDQPFIYVNEDIGKRIKDHQLEGIRFMWNQIVLDPKSRHGCLLAHTMGLGKTMQVITLLVVIRESATSADPNVRAQIPRDLRDSKTVVVCPPGLVNNWVDELLMWAPDDILGQFRKVDAMMSDIERPEAVRKWAQDGGVLIIGYGMLNAMVSPDSEVESLLLNTANIVIADEAHVMKNPSTKANRSCSRFITKSRIALTGSPLANNVEEYHAMIDWVTPNFLGPLTEFRQIYAVPIEYGLYKDSTGPQKRTALKRLEALKVMVAPKVNRATIKTCLKEDLPAKWEFVLFVPPTRTQSQLYNMYIDAVRNRADNITQSWVFAVTEVLRLICNHPRCFHEKIKSDKPNSTFPKSIIPQALKMLQGPDLDRQSLSWKVELLAIILDEARAIGDKVLIFSQSITTINYLVKLFKTQKRKFSCLTGNTPVHKRQEQIKLFNKDNQEVYLISTTAGGVGLNIHGANRVVIFDAKWNPVQEQQAIGRAYRIGQKKTVFVYSFVVAGSFEQDLQNRHIFKTQLASRVVDKANPLSWAKRNAKIMHHIRKTRVKSLKEFEGKDQILDKLMQYKMDGQPIRSVLSTDTFEEEDPDFTLTEVERQDVDMMVEETRLRAKDTSLERDQNVEKQEGHYRLAQVSTQVAPPLLQPLQPNRIHPPPKPQPSTNQSLRGASDPLDRASDGFALNPDPRPTPASQPVAKIPGAGSLASHPSGSVQSSGSGFGPALLPVTGANTYFGSQSCVSRPSNATPIVTPALTSKQALDSLPAPRPTPTPHRATFPGGNPFIQSSNQSKLDFQNRLESRIDELRQRGSFDTIDDSTKVGKILTDEIDAVRKNMGHGFLPDNQRWKELESFLAYDHFVIALVSGHWTSTWVAKADKYEIDDLIKATTGIPGQVISAQANRKASCPDPDNLRNIDRAGVRERSTSQGLHAHEDMEAMREVVDNRKRRGKLPPLPGHPASSASETRAFPAKETMD